MVKNDGKNDNKFEYSNILTHKILFIICQKILKKKESRNEQHLKKNEYERKFSKDSTEKKKHAKSICCERKIGEKKK